MAPSLSKRRKLSKNDGPTEEEIKFDYEARKEFLTGFHKRKLQRAKHAQEAAERRMKEEKREQRKRVGLLLFPSYFLIFFSFFC